MGISTQTITVDLSKQLTRPQVVRLGQGDKRGTTLVADIYDNGVAYNLTGKTARFSMRAPDGTASYSVVASSCSGNKATFDLDETYAASIAGKTDTAYIEVLSGSTVICSTSRITVIVYRSASQGLPVSGAYSDALEEAISTFAEMQRAFADMQRAFADMQELVMPPATTTTLGGVIVGDGLDVASDGTLSFEAGDHSHSASDITDGTLAVAHGGTGVTTAAAERERLGLGSTTGALPIANGGTGLVASPSALVDLASSAAASMMQASPRPGVTGTLPVAHGGTGATTASDARTNLSVYSKAEVDAEIAGIGIVTGTSTVSNGVWEWIKLPGGIAIAHYRDTSDRTIDITSASGSLYWASINSLSFPFAFAHQPSVSVSASGTSNFFTWASNVTTTATGQIYVGRGNQASGVKTRVCITVTGIYS